MAGDVAYVPDKRVLPTREQLRDWSFSSREGSSDLVAFGPCPTCDHDCTVRVVREIATEAAGAEADTSGPPEEKSTRKFPCTCSVPHEGRPPAVSGGCGRWFLAAIERRGTSWTLTGDVDESTLGALVALEQAASEEVSRVRTSAEKWLPGITALYGLFGLAGIALGKDAVSGLAPAGKAILALFIALGLASTVFAILSGYRAAFGWYEVVGVNTDEKLKDWYARRREAVLTAPKSLQKAIMAAVAALACLLIGVFVIWFWPAKSPAAPNVTLTYRPAGSIEQATVCGRLKGLAGGNYTIAVTSPSRSDPVKVPREAVDKIELKAKCS